MRFKVEHVLATLGPHSAAIVTPYACAGIERPEFAPSLRIHVSTLEAARQITPLRECHASIPHIFV